MTSNPGASPLTLMSAVRQVAQALREAGIEDAAAEARWLVAAAADVNALDLVLSEGRPVAPDIVDRIGAYTQRRSAREPLSRIIGRRAFYGRDFNLSEGTLDPRPDTETIIDVVLSIWAERNWPGRQVKILDVGTGTGAILITLLAELPSARGIGIDISADALHTAAQNASRLGVAARATFKQFDVCSGLGGDTIQSADGFDFIVSNPPYIPSAKLAHLQPEVRLHDPAAALDGGSDGLDFYRILAKSVVALSPGGWLVVEVGAGQSGAVEALFHAAAPGAQLRTAVDLAGHTRIVAMQPRPHRFGE